MILLIWDFFVYFSYFGIFICLSTILMSFAPKKVEGIFSSMFFTLEIAAFVFSAFISGLLVWIFDMNFNKNFELFNIIFVINIIMISMGFYFIFILVIPKN